MNGMRVNFLLRMDKNEKWIASISLAFSVLCFCTIRNRKMRTHDCELDVAVASRQWTLHIMHVMHNMHNIGAPAISSSYCPCDCAYCRCCTKKSLHSRHRSHRRIEHFNWEIIFYCTVDFRFIACLSRLFQL